MRVNKNDFFACKAQGVISLTSNKLHVKMKLHQRLAMLENTRQTYH